MGDKDRTGFAKRLRALMDARGLNAKSLCWAMGLDTNRRQMIDAWLRGERYPNYESLKALQRALRCEWEELMDE